MGVPIAFTELSVDGGDGFLNALVLTPKQPQVLGRERMEGLRHASGLSKVDRMIVGEAAARKGNIQLAFFRAMDEQGQIAWSFDETLSPDECDELGYLLVRALLPIHRRMMAQGIGLLVHSEWGDRECSAMRHGREKNRRELEDRIDSEPVAAADAWILRNMLFHSTLPIEKLVRGTLPSQLRLIAARQKRIGELIAALPEDALAF